MAGAKRPKRLAIALVALAAPGLDAGVALLVLSEASADIVGLVETAIVVPSDKSLIATGVDQFPRH